MVISICNSLQFSQSCQNGAKYCKLLQTIARSQQVILIHKTKKIYLISIKLVLKQPQLDSLLNYLTTLISNSWALSIRLDALRCLSYVVFESGPLCTAKVCNDLSPFHVLQILAPSSTRSPTTYVCSTGEQGSEYNR